MHSDHALSSYHSHFSPLYSSTTSRSNILSSLSTPLLLSSLLTSRSSTEFPPMLASTANMVIHVITVKAYDTIMTLVTHVWRCATCVIHDYVITGKARYAFCHMCVTQSVRVRQWCSLRNWWPSRLTCLFLFHSLLFFEKHHRIRSLNVNQVHELLLCINSSRIPQVGRLLFNGPKWEISQYYLHILMLPPPWRDGDVIGHLQPIAISNLKPTSVAVSIRVHNLHQKFLSLENVRRAVDKQQWHNTVAIGIMVASTKQGRCSVAADGNAARLNPASFSIVINGTSNLETTHVKGLYIKQFQTRSQTQVLLYDPISVEITYDTATADYKRRYFIFKHKFKHLLLLLWSSMSGHCQLTVLQLV